MATDMNENQHDRINHMNENRWAKIVSTNKLTMETMFACLNDFRSCGLSIKRIQSIFFR
jgi:hypothetical protein